jgi:1,4-dihydroxy-2-naphthoate octaprenyltransferase
MSLFSFSIRIFHIVCNCHTVGNTAMAMRFWWWFVFFGLVSTFRVNFYTPCKLIELVLPAIAIDYWSVGMNLNNMRDEASDRKSNQPIRSLVSKIGGLKAKFYHYILIVNGWFWCWFFAIIDDFNFDAVLVLLPTLGWMEMEDKTGTSHLPSPCATKLQIPLIFFA